MGLCKHVVANMYHLRYNLCMSTPPILEVVFFNTGCGNEPVRDWLRAMDTEDRKVVGEDIKLTQLRWPIGMPLVRKLAPGLWEVRSYLRNGRVARVLFTVHGHDMVLLHSFEKKSNKIRKKDLELSKQRKRLYEEAGNEQI